MGTITHNPKPHLCGLWANKREYYLEAVGLGRIYSHKNACNVLTQVRLFMHVSVGLCVVAGACNGSWEKLNAPQTSHTVTEEGQWRSTANA